MDNYVPHIETQGVVEDNTATKIKKDRKMPDTDLNNDRVKVNGTDWYHKSCRIVRNYKCAMIKGKLVKNPIMAQYPAGNYQS